MTDLLALAARCERAAGGDREMDIEILRAITGKHWLWMDGQRTVTWAKYGCRASGNPVCSLEQFTVSIDDAMAIIPDGWFFSGLDQASPAVRVWTEGNIAFYSPGLDGPRAATPALALCAAALRARASVGALQQRGADGDK